MRARPWHELEVLEVTRELGLDPEKGLDADQAARRLAEEGPNLLVEAGQKKAWRILWEQLTALMMLVLLVAALISALLGDLKDTIAIATIVLLNALLGFSQEYRAERAIAALKQLAAPKVRVRRGARVLEVPGRDVVRGEVVLLEAGRLIPADGRIARAASLRVQEAVLTGESEPVDKTARAVPGIDLALGDRRSMAYMGTAVAYGHGEMIVTETGMHTELGRIAALMQEVQQQQTPLQKRLNHLTAILAAVALSLVVAIFALGLLRGEEVRLMLMTAVSIAVAAVPEGLPAVVTIALALGAQRMLRRRALVRKLPAVETLGSVTVICSDKTGTLTENRMTVVALDANGHRVDRPGEREPHENQAFSLLLAAGALCTDVVEAEPARDSSSPFPGGPVGVTVLGDPTEVALVAAAGHWGLHKAQLEEAFPRVGEVPFDSERRRMTTVHLVPRLTQRSASEAVLRLHHSAPELFDTLRDSAPELFDAPSLTVTKGALEALLDVASGVLSDGRVEVLDDERRAALIRANDELAEEGRRVLAVALRPLSAQELGWTHAESPKIVEELDSALEATLTLIGLVGLMDPPRPEVREAVRTCQAAGVRPVMITGDHPLTAIAVARDLGIEDSNVLNGVDLAGLSPEDLDFEVNRVRIYARVSPEHKLRIVNALQRRGEVVAMTGDGVNDAPALRKADIGVAMGITGTDVSKEAADMILLDDNFATIVAAVEEGRIIYGNIRKFLRYLLSANSGEIVVMLVGLMVGMPLPLLPLQILWMNLVTDGLPALALAMEPAEQDTMTRPPRHPGERLLDRSLGGKVIFAGLFMGAVSLAVGYAYWAAGDETWQTMVFTTLVLSQIALALAVRSGRASVLEQGLFSNPYLLGAVAVTFVFQLLVVYVPPLQNLFRTVTLHTGDLLLALALSSLVFWAVEGEKLLGRRRRGEGL